MMLSVVALTTASWLAMATIAAMAWRFSSAVRFGLFWIFWISSRMRACASLSSAPFRVPSRMREIVAEMLGSWLSAGRASLSSGEAPAGTEPAPPAAPPALAAARAAAASDSAMPAVTSSFLSKVFANSASRVSLSMSETSRTSFSKSLNFLLARKARNVHSL